MLGLKSGSIASSRGPEPYQQQMTTTKEPKPWHTPQYILPDAKSLSFPPTHRLVHHLINMTKYAYTPVPTMTDAGTTDASLAESPKNIIYSPAQVAESFAAGRLVTEGPGTKITNVSHSKRPHASSRNKKHAPVAYVEDAPDTDDADASSSNRSKTSATPKRSSRHKASKRWYHKQPEPEHKQPEPENKLIACNACRNLTLIEGVPTYTPTPDYLRWLHIILLYPWVDNIDNPAVVERHLVLEKMPLHFVCFTPYAASGWYCLYCCGMGGAFWRPSFIRKV